ncbi:hypothetical protein GAY33_33715 [Azospirillum brasilense]|uniref:hypothetical protein n=1 Tax=Azospirillum argentinense TaxID=2970906 RepID=UPI00190F0060|nr:hypothetical protein [Azospirillum argentinense]MBK3804039.1 hypothetical protein [Azospirillum argentinense]
MRTLVKGMRVRAEWFEARPFDGVSLAGVQLKVAAKPKIVEGAVTHIRGNDPVAPTSVGVWIMTDAGEEVVIDARHIVDAEAPDDPE